MPMLSSLFLSALDRY
uniref:Uncharacterized protein n=1 Tax=Arundo donax TaxID=35708 RepID=A0A0A9HUH2_ARUDO